RAKLVTGVQTCALPIWLRGGRRPSRGWPPLNFLEVVMMQRAGAEPGGDRAADQVARDHGHRELERGLGVILGARRYFDDELQDQIGRASCRERVSISVV